MNHAGILLLLVLPLLAEAETMVPDTIGTPRNAIGMTYGGDGAGFSLRYERNQRLDERWLLFEGVAAGLNGSNFRDCQYCVLNSRTFVTLSVQVTAAVGRNRHFFEFGLGDTAFLDGDLPFQLLYPLAGYRFLARRRGGLYFRVTSMLPVAALARGTRLVVRFSRVDDAKHFRQIYFNPIGIGFGITF